MSQKTDFWKKYEHPLWQKKRLEILERDRFTCRDCDAQGKQLHVHHRYYIKDRNPWDYPEWSLVTLCKDCHSEMAPIVGPEGEFCEEEWEVSMGWMCGNKLEDEAHIWFLAAEIEQARKQGIDMTGLFRLLERQVEEIRHISNLMTPARS